MRLTVPGGRADDDLAGRCLGFTSESEIRRLTHDLEDDHFHVLRFSVI